MTISWKIFKSGAGWGLYDIANSGYFLVFVLYLFPVYLSKQQMPHGISFEFAWGITQGIAVAVAVLAGMGLSTWIDKRDIAIVAPRVIASVPVLSLLIPVAIGLGASATSLMVVYVFVHGSYLLSLTIYDGTLRRIARDDVETTKVSGWAWGWGYAGGILCLGLMEIGLHFYPRFSAFDFGLAALFFIFVSILASKWLSGNLRTAGNRTDVLKENLAGVNAEPEQNVWILLVWILLIVDGIAVFMTFVSVYASTTLGLSERDMTPLLGLLQILAWPLTGLLVSAASRHSKIALLGCGVGWATTTALLLTASGKEGFLVTIIAAACVVGTTQALLRAIYACEVMPHREMSGFSKYAVVEKGAAFAAPALAGSMIPLIGYKAVFVGAAILILLGCVLTVARLRNKRRLAQ